MAERMPTDRRVPSSGNPSLVVNREPLAVGGELSLPAPNSDIGTALRTRRKTATGGPEVPLLNRRGKVRLLRNWVGKEPAFFRRHGLLGPSQYDLGQ